LTNRKKAFDTKKTEKNSFDTKKIISSSWVVFSNKPTNCSKFMHTHTSQAGITTIINGKNNNGKNLAQILML
jgi:hypothetical protein